MAIQLAGGPATPVYEVGIDGNPVASIGDASAANQTTQIARETSILGQLDITLSALRDALRGGSNKTLTDLATLLAAPISTSPSTPSIATYSAAASFTIAASATDVFTINGSASKTVKVRKMRISGVATAASEVDIAILKRSAADTGGTAATATNVPHDSQNAAGTAVVKGYTANPSGLGASVGTVKYVKSTVTTSAGAIPNIVYEWTFGGDDQPIVLRGVAEGLCVNLGGVTTTGLVLAISVEWTEE